MERKRSGLEVFLNPRKTLAELMDDENFWGDAQFMPMPFCSHDLFLMEGAGNILEDLFEEKLFLRQEGISQLQNLTPETAEKNAFFSLPVFPHKRYHHAKMVAMMAAVMVGKWEMPWEEALTFVAAAAYHDAATVAGGDAIRSAFDILCEERNFSECIAGHGLDAKWRPLGFDLGGAQLCVEGKGRLGQLLDYLDKVSYTLLDCHFFGRNMPEVLQDFIGKYPLFGDVWTDARFDGDGIYFADAERLHVFAMARALMHAHLYKNPACRRIEHIVAKETRSLLANGVISFEDLKREDDAWLALVLEKHDCNIRSYMTPDIIGWKRFSRGEDCSRYAERLGGRLLVTEEIKPFKTGLGWRVASNGGTELLRNVLPEGNVGQLENLASLRSGWYVYYYEDN